MRILDREGISLRKSKDVWYAMTEEDAGSSTTVKKIRNERNT